MDVLDRLFQRLVQNIRAARPQYLSDPFEVGELYTTLVPYRHNRAELGIEMNQDYEAALMRLLSGEREYVLGDPVMQRALTAELGSPNPDTTLYRQFAESRVTVNPDAAGRVAPGGPPQRSSVIGGGLAGGEQSAAPARPALANTGVMSTLPPGAGGNEPPAVRLSGPSERAGADAALPDPASFEFPLRAPSPATPRGSGAAAGPSASTPPASRPSVSAAPPVVPTPAHPMGVVAEASCRYCAGPLPEGRRITYCPHCGQNLTVRQCPACSTELEVGWRFCVTCGRQA